MEKYLCDKESKTIGIQEWNKLRKINKYPNLLVMKKWISKFESAVVKNFDNSFYFSSKQKKQIAVNLEWFFTWRLKLAPFPHLIWCDGVVIKQLKSLSKIKYQIVGEIWLRPESDVSVEFLYPIKGLFIIDKYQKKFNSYKFEIEYESQKYIICNL